MGFGKRATALAIHGLCAAWLVGCGGSSDRGEATIPPLPPPTPVGDIGAWDDGSQSFSQTFYVRPPGQSYGTGDGSSWTNAFSDLPPSLVRGAKYFVASGEYDEVTPQGNEPYVDHSFEDPEDGDKFIAIVKATASEHGGDEGWAVTLDQGPASFGPIGMVTGHYLLDGVTGEGNAEHGMRIAVKPAVCTNNNANAFYFNWNAQSHQVALHHLDISFCGAVDLAGPPQDAIYGYATDSYSVGQVTIRDCWVHDTTRVLAFFLSWDDVLLEHSFFERSGQAQESSSLAMRSASNVVVRDNVFKDAINVYVSLQDVRNVHIYGNVFVTTLTGWDGWNSIYSGDPATDVFIYDNTFYGLTGLSTGMRFEGSTTNLVVMNNIWAHNRTNQIPMAGQHDYNAFFDNIRPDSQEDLSLGEDEPHVQVITVDPFVDAAGLDFHLATATDPGSSLGAPYDRDPDGVTRGADGTWDRGAFELP
jgi:hypothetical protein